MEEEEEGRGLTPCVLSLVVGMHPPSQQVFRSGLHNEPLGSQAMAMVARAMREVKIVESLKFIKMRQE